MPRLSGERADLATRELLWLLVDHPEGLPTSALTGTDRFHGGNTLPSKEIARLLRASGLVDEDHIHYGIYTRIWWKLKRFPGDQGVGFPARPGPRKSAEGVHAKWLAAHRSSPD